jgi:hypothetical protein
VEVNTERKPSRSNPCPLLTGLPLKVGADGGKRGVQLEKLLFQPLHLFVERLRRWGAANENKARVRAQPPFPTSDDVFSALSSSSSFFWALR